MFDDLPPDLDRLRTLRIWHALWVQRIDAKIAALQRRQAEEESGRRRRPRPPEWIVELGIGADRSPVQVHAGDCHMAGQRRRAVSRDEARRLLATGLEGCGHCRPAARLHIIELSTPRCRYRSIDSAPAATGVTSGL
ncbi:MULTISPECIES: DUF6233 domain-containing protein [unclassified Streptomyces]|uniref:DUF6233 domain-containing protein n=1 Tax=unclassified Streptomyces TaxID=2593676 RepID=UPI001F470C2E|nr:MULTISPECIES: DUF6233 domain-containing protein [unclassified Streptomyces]